MKIICSSREKEQLIELISESDTECRENCPLYEECDYDCAETLENNIDWEAVDEI